VLCTCMETNDYHTCIIAIKLKFPFHLHKTYVVSIAFLRGKYTSHSITKRKSLFKHTCAHSEYTLEIENEGYELVNCYDVFQRNLVSELHLWSSYPASSKMVYSEYTQQG